MTIATRNLRSARKESDRREAWAEYRREVADAGKDYRKEMREKAYAVGRVTVSQQRPESMPSGLGCATF
jgi:hypothetical protein